MQKLLETRGRQGSEDVVSALAHDHLSRTRSPLVSCRQECGRWGIRVPGRLLLAPELIWSVPARLGGEAAPSAAEACTLTRVHTPVPLFVFRGLGRKFEFAMNIFPLQAPGSVPSPHLLPAGVDSPSNSA